MDFNISFDAQSGQQALSNSQLFRKYLQMETFEGKMNVTQEREVLKEDEAGGLLSSILKVQLSEEALMDFVRSLGGWLKRPKSSQILVTIQTPTGTTIKIQGNKLEEGGGETLHKILEALRQEEAVKLVPDNLRAQCKNLIAVANTAQVLLLLTAHIEKISVPENDFFLLKSQWNQIEKEYLMGLSSREDINREKARVNYALLEMLDKLEG